jgi:hypothetical protein
MEISPEIVKFGAHLNITEAKTMIHVTQNTGVLIPEFPVPKVSLIIRTVQLTVMLAITEAFMIPTLSWVSLPVKHSTQLGTLGVSAKSHISRQLASYIQEIRDMGNVSYIDSIDHGPITDHSLSTSIDKGITPRP